MEKIQVVAIAGPTASGKTAYSVGFAKEHNGEIISCDSMQVYRGMDIGTAKVTKEEMDGVPHYMLDVAEPFENFSVAAYCEGAAACIREIAARGKLPIVTGGTGLYMDSLLNAVQFTEKGGTEELRQEIAAEIAEKGNVQMHGELEKIDPASAARIHANDTKRLVRAIEIYRGQGITMTEAMARSKADCPYAVRHIGLDFAERERLYQRIDLRVEQMLAEGLLEEVGGLLQIPGVRGSTAMQAIGYKEIAAHLDGFCTLAEAKENIQRESRRYAKRQLTWFRKDKSREWIVR